MDKVKNAKLKKVIKDLSPEKKLFAEKLAVEIEFMADSLQDTRDIIRRDGTITQSKNGNGIASLREHPAVKTYNTTIKSYTSAIRQLTALLDTEEQKEEIDDFQKITGLM